MGEIKSVKVDNWGVFFLQKLQNFFNKTDYCDLTLQFRDNSQLKVHRLVLSACTDYFNVLEQTCEVVDDAIIMPNGLQADVVVPIVNFMYTGTLEFELKMYNRLLRTAKDMNMTVLLKLLEAHRRTMEMHPQKNQAPTSPKARRKVAPPNIAGGLPTNSAGRSLIQPQNKRIVVSGSALQQQHRIAPSNAYARLTSSAVVGALPVKQQIGSTTFTRIKQESEQESNIVKGGYTLLKKSPQQSMTTSPFEQLRKAYTNNNKRPAPATFISPPAKKPNLEDVKEFAEQQRMRKQIAAEYGDDGDYDTGIMDDDTIHNDDDDDDMAASGPTSQQQVTAPNSSSDVPTSSSQQPDDPPGTTTIIVKHEGPDKPPTIVVKDSSNSKMNHAKIISEVLRQYPHLVNSNKNIKLKIMPNTGGGQTQKVIVKKEVAAETEKPAPVVSSAVVATKLPTLPKVEAKVSTTSTALTGKVKQQTAQTSNIPVADTSNKDSGVAPSAVAAVASQKRRIDSKTMHALIALGAENTSGPWLCLRCGRNGHPISIPSYRGFRRHLINTHKEAIDPALCEHCGWRSSSKRELHFHMQLEHKVRTNLYIFPDCQLCQQICIDSDALNQHLIDSHPDENKQQCIYCNKIFPEELQLYTHMKTFHKKQALEDGIIDYSDDENTNIEPVFPPLDDDEMTSEQEHEAQTQPEKKIKILSDISLPTASSIMKTESFVTQHATAGESTTSVATEEYLQDQEHVETKFVAADGSEVILTEEQRKEILSQLNQENEGSGVVMVLNENQQFAGGETQSEQGAISHDETSQATTATNEEQEHEDSHIYSEIKSQTPGVIEEDTVSQPEPDTGDQEQQDDHQVHDDRVEKLQHEHLDESKESIDNLEWAENLISEHDMAEDVPQTSGDARSNDQHKKEEPKEEYKTQDDISRKLKELAGEWSEDEDVDEEMHEDLSEEIVKKGPNDSVENVEKVHETESVENVKIIDEVVDTPESTKLEEQNEEEVAPPVSENTQQVEQKIKEENVEKPVEEDDVDLALKCLHKEDDGGDKPQSDNASENEKGTKEIVSDLANITESKNEQDDTQNDVKTDENQDHPIEGESIKTLAGEESKKDIIDILISEHEDTGSKDSTTEKPAVNSVELKDEKIADINTGESAKDEPAVEDEFLDITPEKVAVCKEEPNTTDSTTEKESNSSAAILAKDAISSEERVKSLISEWGDEDDEDENENTDLRAEL